jgi:hypothetical protein
MGITTSDQHARNEFSELSRSKPRCWECDEEKPVLMLHPADQRPICRDCADYWGLRFPPMSADSEEDDGDEA